MALFLGWVMAYRGVELLMGASDQVVRAFPVARFVVTEQGPELECLDGELRQRRWFERRNRFVPDFELAQLVFNTTKFSWALPNVASSTMAVNDGLIIATSSSVVGQGWAQFGACVAPLGGAIAADREAGEAPNVPQ